MAKREQENIMSSTNKSSSAGDSDVPRIGDFIEEKFNDPVPGESDVLFRQIKNSKTKKEALESLAEMIERKFQQRANNRKTKEAEWIRALELYFGHLSHYDMIGTGQSIDRFFNEPRRKRRPTHNIVRTKCDVAISQSISIQFAGGDKNWDIHPTPVPEGADQKEAAVRASRMEEVIEDQLSECNYGYEARTAIQDRVIYGTGILKGPVNTPKMETRYVSVLDPLSQVEMWVPEISAVVRPSVKRVDPWLFFPDDRTNNFEECEDTIEVHLFTKHELAKLINNPGFYGEEIVKVLRESLSANPDGSGDISEKVRNNPDSRFGYYSTYVIRSSSLLNRNNPSYLQGKFAVLEYHGPVTRAILSALDIDPGYESPIDCYYAEVWVCNGRTIRVELSNIEGDFELPYAVCQWLKDPGSVFGFGVPIILEDQQRVVNATWQMILDNAAASSAPILFVNKHMIEPADRDWQIGPGKIYYMTEYGEDVRKAVNFIITPNASGPLMEVLNLAKGFSEEESSIPLISAGLNSPQVATSSASGLAIMQHASTTVLDYMSEAWDDQVTKKIISRFYAWNMQYNPNPEIKGDFKIDVKSASDLRNKQLYLQNLEKLAVEAVQNEELKKVINTEELTRARLAMMHLPNYPIVKSDDQLAAEREKAQREGSQNVPPPEVLRYQVEMQRLQLEQQKMQFEAEKFKLEYELEAMKQAIMRERDLSQNYATIMKEQAEAYNASAQNEIAMLKLLAEERDAERRAAMQIELERIRQEAAAKMNELKAAQAQIELLLRARDQQLKEEELGYAYARGKGI